MQARLIKGIQKPRPEFETVGACLIMIHGISDAGANFECWYVEFLGHHFWGELHGRRCDFSGGHDTDNYGYSCDYSIACDTARPFFAARSSCGT